MGTGPQLVLLKSLEGSVEYRAKWIVGYFRLFYLCV